MIHIAIWFKRYCLSCIIYYSNCIIPQSDNVQGGAGSLRCGDFSMEKHYWAFQQAARHCATAFFVCCCFLCCGNYWAILCIWYLPLVDVMINVEIWAFLLVFWLNFRIPSYLFASHSVKMASFVFWLIL